MGQDVEIELAGDRSGKDQNPKNSGLRKHNQKTIEFHRELSSARRLMPPTIYQRKWSWQCWMLYQCESNCPPLEDRLTSNKHLSC